MGSSGKPFSPLACQLRAAVTSLDDPVRVPLTGHGPEPGLSKKNPHHISQGFPWAAGFWQESPHGGDCGVNFWGPRARQRKRKMERGCGVGIRRQRQKTTQTGFRSCCNGFGKKHQEIEPGHHFSTFWLRSGGETEPGQLQRERKCWGQMWGSFRK